MCGILCILDLLQTGSISIDSELHALLNRRGPDKHSTWIENNILFNGYVLWQQGIEPTSQPLVSQKSILLLNGDIYNCNKNSETSDSSWLLEKLDSCNSEIDIINLFQILKGPFSIIFYNRETKELFFGRDSLGRNSLIIEKDLSNQQLRILSTSYSKKTSTNLECIELPALGLFKLNIDNLSNINLYPWKTYDENLIKELENALNIKVFVQKSIVPDWLQKGTSQFDFDFYNIVRNINTNDIFSSVLQIKNVSVVINKLIELLQKSVRDRINTTPKYCTLCVLNNNIASDEICQHSKIGILFSGGLDCSILAALVHKDLAITESIDLINVAFEKSSVNPSNNIDWNVPDRCSAKESYQELKNLCPERKWNFIEVNITRAELVKELNLHLRHLIYPLKTILDESLGSAFWFAGRGQGFFNNARYCSNCRVILTGTGADELFGGYVRHRNVYRRTNGSHIEKLAAVHNELQFDWERIPLRNLGRDDRVIADNGKTARAPYIEEDVVEFVINLRTEQKCCFDLEEGLGDKFLLRLCAHKLGLKFSTKLKKRAFQFGSKIANKNQNAHDISIYLER